MQVTGSRWKPGESGNPRGRAKGAGDVGRLRAEIAKHLPDIIAKQVELLRQRLDNRRRGAAGETFKNDAPVARSANGKRRRFRRIVVRRADGHHPYSDFSQ